jgi:hypothetical protein
VSYIKVIALGRIGAAEKWSCGVVYRNFELFAASMSQTMIESLANRLITGIPSASIPSTLKSVWSNAVSITGWRVEQHGEDEKLTNVGEAAYAAAPVGSGSMSKSPQDALVVSLRTSTPGARGRGRIYWPALGVGLNGEFQVTTPTQAQIALATAQLFQLIGDQIKSEWAANSMAVTPELAVRSITDHMSRKVERLQVGSILDTQRRRRDSLVETYVMQNYPAT